MKNEEYMIDNIYIGFQKKEEYNEYLDEYELWEDHILLNKTKYGISFENKGFNIYQDINTGDKLYINSEGFVLDSDDEEAYNRVEGIISVKDLLKKFENTERENSQYRNYVYPQYKRVCLALNDSDSITKDYLGDLFGNICDIYSYTFELCTEEDYEDLLGCQVYDFETGGRVRK